MEGFDTHAQGYRIEGGLDRSGENRYTLRLPMYGGNWATRSYGYHTESSSGIASGHVSPNHAFAPHRPTDTTELIDIVSYVLNRVPAELGASYRSKTTSGGAVSSATESLTSASASTEEVEQVGHESDDASVGAHDYASAYVSLDEADGMDDDSMTTSVSTPDPVAGSESDSMGEDQTSPSPS